MAFRQEKEKAVNVQVLLRCRPFNEDELRSNAPRVITCKDDQREVSVSQNIAGKQYDRVFTFDKVFGPSAKQKDVYEQAVVPIVNEVLEGFNCTIFAYGQTGTGKTYTMEGENRRAKNGLHGELSTDAGVIPRAVKQIFDTLESQNAEYSVKVTFIELYNEEITDLLAPEELSKVALEERQKKPLPLMEDGKGGVLVRGIEEEIVTSANEIFSLLERGSAKRRTAETLLNKQSSRSHSLFSITIHIKEATPEGEELIKCGKLNLVDLAGSENISRSGAREGRAREAGEINKSLLTLGRVITALVEHLGHIPYRDSKLTRLLRDSLGGRTKTCIIATVSPSVHCLEETLSTLDYAHRAKNIKNKPEVNQKMMKSTLIKDLYAEIDRLKAEVYASREKVGVYIPRERYEREEGERKAMEEQIEQMGVMLVTNQKQLDDLHIKYEDQLQQSADLRKKLDATEEWLEHTSKLLTNAKDDLKQAQYALDEKEFIISKQKKAECDLAHQACDLRAELEKSIRDNSLLFSKLAKEDQLNVSNRNLVNNFQSDLSNRISSLCNTVVRSLDQQKKHLERVQELCQGCLAFHDKAVTELNKKVTSSRSLYNSYIEAVQNVVKLHKASSNTHLGEILASVSANSCSLDQLLAFGVAEANQAFTDIQEMISIHRSEVAHFTQELRERFAATLDHVAEMSNFVVGLLDKIVEESTEFHSTSSKCYEAQMTNIVEFQKAYEEQSRYEKEKLVADIANLVSGHMTRQQDLVSARLNILSGSTMYHEKLLNGHTSTMTEVANDAKRKWEEFSLQAGNDAKDGSNFSSAKHCKMELDLQKCVSAIDAALQRGRSSNASASEMNAKHVKQMGEIVLAAIGSNDDHVREVASAHSAAKEDAAKDHQDLLSHFDGLLEHERGCQAQVMSVLETHSATLERLVEDHASEADAMNREAEATFQNNYKEYERTGETPARAEMELPTKAAIDSLRALPVEDLLEEFRENHPYENAKEPKPSLIPRSPLVQLN